MTVSVGGAWGGGRGDKKGWRRRLGQIPRRGVRKTSWEEAASTCPSLRSQVRGSALQDKAVQSEPAHGSDQLTQNLWFKPLESGQLRFIFISETDKLCTLNQTAGESKQPKVTELLFL